MFQNNIKICNFILKKFKLFKKQNLQYQIIGGQK